MTHPQLSETGPTPQQLAAYILKHYKPEMGELSYDKSGRITDINKFVTGHIGIINGTNSDQVKQPYIDRLHNIAEQVRARTNRNYS